MNKCAWKNKCINEDGGSLSSPEVQTLILFDSFGYVLTLTVYVGWQSHCRLKSLNFPHHYDIPSYVVFVCVFLFFKPRTGSKDIPVNISVCISVSDMKFFTYLICPFLIMSALIGSLLHSKNTCSFNVELLLRWCVFSWVQCFPTIYNLSIEFWNKSVTFQNFSAITGVSGCSCQKKNWSTCCHLSHWQISVTCKAFTLAVYSCLKIVPPCSTLFKF